MTFYPGRVSVGVILVEFHVYTSIKQHPEGEIATVSRKISCWLGLVVLTLMYCGMGYGMLFTCGGRRLLEQSNLFESDLERII